MKRAELKTADLTAECVICWSHKLIEKGDFNLVGHFYCNDCMKD